jgi:hypothetical protein
MASSVKLLTAASPGAAADGAAGAPASPGTRPPRCSPEAATGDPGGDDGGVGYPCRPLVGGVPMEGFALAYMQLLRSVSPPPMTLSPLPEPAQAPAEVGKGGAKTKPVESPSPALPGASPAKNPADTAGLAKWSYLAIFCCGESGGVPRPPCRDTQLRQILELYERRQEDSSPQSAGQGSLRGPRRLLLAVVAFMVVVLLLIAGIPSVAWDGGAGGALAAALKGSPFAPAQSQSRAIAIDANDSYLLVEPSPEPASTEAPDPPPDGETASGAAEGDAAAPNLAGEGERRPVEERASGEDVAAGDPALDIRVKVAVEVALEIVQVPASPPANANASTIAAPTESAGAGAPEAAPSPSERPLAIGHLSPIVASMKVGGMSSPRRPPRRRAPKRRHVPPAFKPQHRPLPRVTHTRADKVKPDLPPSAATPSPPSTTAGADADNPAPPEALSPPPEEGGVPEVDVSEPPAGEAGGPEEGSGKGEVGEAGQEDDVDAREDSRPESRSWASPRLAATRLAFRSLFEYAPASGNDGRGAATADVDGDERLKKLYNSAFIKEEIALMEVSHMLPAEPSGVGLVSNLVLMYDAQVVMTCTWEFVKRSAQINWRNLGWCDAQHDPACRPSRVARVARSIARAFDKLKKMPQGGACRPGAKDGPSPFHTGNRYYMHGDRVASAEAGREGGARGPTRVLNQDGLAFIRPWTMVTAESDLLS